MQKDILFYQANFEPEVCRAINCLEKKDLKHFEFFKIKTVKIVDEILKLSKKSVEKEEWFAIKNLVQGLETLDQEEIALLKNYGNSFSNKYARKFV